MARPLNKIVKSVIRVVRYTSSRLPQGAKNIIFTACHSGKLKLTLTGPDVISTSPRHFLTSRIDFVVLLLFEWAICTMTSFYY